MESYKVLLSPSSKATRVLVMHGQDELLRANLPPETRHERAASRFLEAVSLWLDTPLRVVLSVDAQAASFCLGLTDEMGVGARSVFYRVEVVVRGSRRRRGKRIPGIGEFRDLRQLSLVLDPESR